MKTELKNRTLWFDGDVTVTSEELQKHILNFGNINNVFIDNETDDEIVLYNKLAVENKLTKKIELKEILKKWNLPSWVLNINLYDYILKKHLDYISSKNFTEDLIINRIKRVKKEFSLYEKLDLLPLLRCVIYIVDTFEKNNIIWGTGRGSSCASYILYVIGLHEIDPELYNIDYKEFFKIDG